MTQRATLQEQQAAFDAYVTAAKKARESHDLNDGILAGKAWARFLDLFLDEPLGPLSNVVPLRTRQSLLHGDPGAPRS